MKIKSTKNKTNSIFKKINIIMVFNYIRNYKNSIQLSVLIDS